MPLDVLGSFIVAVLPTTIEDWYLKTSWEGQGGNATVHIQLS